MKKRYNKGKDNNLYFYRDSSQNEIDLLIKDGSDITAVEIKSSMTYHPEFEKTLRKLGTWINTPVKNKAIIYTGNYENSIGEIKLLNYRNMYQAL